MENLEYTNSFSLENSYKNAVDDWQHPLHRTCSRLGSFPPELAHFFIKKYSTEGDKVLDPFSGKGTTPLEACLLDRVGIGNDASPDAYTLTHGKVKPSSYEDTKKRLEELEAEFKGYNLENTDEDVKIFFSNYNLEQLEFLKEKLGESDTDIFIKSLILGILHGKGDLALSLPMSHSYSMSPSYVKGYAEENNLVKPEKNVFECIRKKAKKVTSRKLPDTEGEAYCEEILDLELDDKVDLIVTSPPYYHALTYAWDNWLRLWFLDHDYKEIRDKLIQTSNEEKYENYMEKSLKKMYEWLDEDSICIVVVGDVKKKYKEDGEEKKRIINTAQRLVEPAKNVGFNTDIRIINDEIPEEDKYSDYIEEDEGVKIDRILELKKGEPEENKVDTNWKIPYGSSQNTMEDFMK